MFKKNQKYFFKFNYVFLDTTKDWNKCHKFLLLFNLKHDSWICNWAFCRFSCDTLHSKLRDPLEDTGYQYTYLLLSQRHNRKPNLSSRTGWSLFSTQSSSPPDDLYDTKASHTLSSAMYTTNSTTLDITFKDTEGLLSFIFSSVQLSF